MSALSHLPDENTRAILFDCDGTLVDTMPVHREVWHQLLLRYDFVITDEWWEEWANLPLLPMVQMAIPGATSDLADQLNVEAMGMYNELLHKLEPLEHVIDVAGITHLFDWIVTADEVIHSKPAPDLYTLAMSRLGVAPEHCLVYEDSEIGMTSARGARAGRIVDIRRWPQA